MKNLVIAKRYVNEFKWIIIPAKEGNKCNHRWYSQKLLLLLYFHQNLKRGNTILLKKEI